MGSNSDDDDEEDNEYVPQQKEIDQYEKEKNNKKKQKNTQKDIQKRDQMLNKIWQEMQQNDVIIRKKFVDSGQQLTHQQIKEISERVINQQNNEQQIKKVYFAGKEFIIDVNGNICENKPDQNQQNQALQQNNIDIANAQEKQEQEENQEIQKNHLTLSELKQSFSYMKYIIEKINSKAKSINSIIKSKLDWKAYAKKQKLEQQFEQKRKAGYLQNQEFLAKVKESEKEHRKKPKLMQ